MRRLFILPLLFLVAFSTTPPTTLTKKERKYAKDYLKDTKKDLVKTVSGLSEAQLKFKAAPDRWSVQECVMHIAKAEQMLWEGVEKGMKDPANPEKRAEIKMTDEQWIAAITDRSKKFKAPEPIQPQNTGFATLQDALNSFKATRGKIIDYVNDTQEDMRSHVVNFPVGVLDAYQMVLFISAHSNRHTQQIKEVMADPNFPKN
jgi:hypothetical protein